MKLHRINKIIGVSVALATVLWLAPVTSKADSLLYIADSGSGNIYTYNTATSVLNLFAPSGVETPSGLAFNSSGDLFVSGSGNNMINEFAPNGTSLGTFTTIGLNEPVGMAFDSSDNLYVANYGGNDISKYSSTGTFLGTIASPTPGGLAFNAAGDLFVSDYIDGTINEFAPNGTSLGTIIGFLANPDELAFDSSGDLFVAQMGGDAHGSVWEYTPNGSGGFTRSLTLNANQVYSGYPGLAIDNNGDLFASDFRNNLIVEYPSGFTDDTTPTTIVSSGLNEPNHLAFAPSVGAVPEPSMFALLGIGGLVLGGYAWRRTKRTA